jgi:hypothetical protein
VGKKREENLIGTKLCSTEIGQKSIEHERTESSGAVRNRTKWNRTGKENREN